MSGNIHAVTWWTFITQGREDEVNQTELAKRLHVDQATISRWRKNPPSAEKAIGVARALDLPVGDALVAAGYLDPTELPLNITKLEDPDDDALLALIARRLGKDGKEAPGGNATPIAIVPPPPSAARAAARDRKHPSPTEQ